MAAPNFISVNQNNPLGLKVINANDLLTSLFAVAEELSERCAQSTADDGTGTQLASEIGVVDAATALALKDLIGSIKTNLNDGGNAFLQFRSRVNRATS